MALVKLIIGFRESQVDLDDTTGFDSPEHKAAQILRQAPPPGLPGFIDVVQRINHINAVIILVDRNKADQFRKAALSWDPIEYCDKNFALRTVSFGDRVAPLYSYGVECAEVYRKYHAPVAEWAGPFGVGMRIAMIDTGISPHFLLPALSSAELEIKGESVHSSIAPARFQQLCADLRQAETNVKQVGIGAPPTAGIPSHQTGLPMIPDPPLRTECKVVLDALVAGSWRDWRHDMTDWIKQGRKTDQPGIPIYRNSAGATRLVSPLSKCFVRDFVRNGILDTDGHGTRMAGVVSALDPRLARASPAKQLGRTLDDPLALDIAGVAPYAELVVLKCLNIDDETDEEGINGSLEAMALALSYCLDDGMDIDAIYIGLALRDAPLHLPMSIVNLLSRLQRSGVEVFAPAGNKGNANPGLLFPSSMASVRAITAVSKSRVSTGLSLCGYSTIADPALHQEVSFCAFGGDIENPIISTSLSGGYAADWGTSFSAAIALGCHTASASALYLKRVTAEYEHIVHGIGPHTLDFVQRRVTDWREDPADRQDLFSALKRNAGYVQGQVGNLPIHEIGSGLIKVLSPADLP